MSEFHPLALLGGITEELSDANYSAMLSNATNFWAVRPSVDGVILLGQGVNDDAAQAIQRCQLPLVTWGSGRDDGALHVLVGSDNLAGGRFLLVSAFASWAGAGPSSWVMSLIPKCWTAMTVLRVQSKLAAEWSWKLHLPSLPLKAGTVQCA